ncbi:luciferase family protein [Nonomuraea sp. NPDC000554]|uniref:luciferase domain-containing protein n=1 Tax=Nonomuraea sp. NPDC000554 TaxID=3154259 RepID=UPI003331F1DE
MVRPQSALRESLAPGLTQAANVLRSWPALTMLPIDDGVSFAAGGREIVRLTGRTAHVHLTRPAIDRLEAALGTCPHVNPSAERGWVLMHVDASLDVDLLLALVSVAIKANV